MAERQVLVVGPDDEPDKYRLRRQIGGGGEAELWEADVTLAGEPERVAVKILRPELADDPKWRQRWAAQVELLRLIQHPGIVGVHAHFEGARMHLPGRAAEQPERAVYLVMNWVDGEDLRAWVPRHRSPEDLPAALRLLGQVAAVLDRLHSGRATPSGRPVVHGDLSPANVVVNTEGQAVLVDFGLSQIARHVTEVPAGTRGYCAPEVVARGEYSPASDRYAFGGLAYYVLTGTHPPADPDQLRAGLAGIEALADQPVTTDEVAAIFATEPARRPAAGDWMRLLRQQTSTATALTAPAPAAPGPGPGTGAGTGTGQRSGRSRRLAVAAAGAVVVALVLGVGLGAGLFSAGRAQTPAGPGAETPDTVPTTRPPEATSPPAPAPTPTASPTPTEPADATLSPWPGEPDGTVFVTGTVALQLSGYGSTFDLDRNREAGSITSRTDLSGNDDGVGAQNGTRFGRWDGDEPPTLRECRELPTSEWTVPFIDADDFADGPTVCVETTAGRYGYLQAQRVERFESGRLRRYHFYYLLWMHPQDR